MLLPSKLQGSGGARLGGSGTLALPPDPEALDAVRSILVSEGKIAAIKAYREMTGAGLRDAKVAVDSLEAS